ncbi:MAG TPA: alpha/beta hydrolase [Chitinophagaceae bacterium]|nr:alpha/beta hydrolase [Chitinophagaceae bacterium]
MPQVKGSKIVFFIKLAFFIYIGSGLLAYLFQDLLILHPKRLPPNHKFHFSEPFTELNVKAEGNRNINIIQFSPREPAKGVVLYFHGNMRNIERYAGFAALFTKHQYDVWMIDYPGFGKSTGKATEEKMCDDALMLYKLAEKKFTPQNIIVYGKSLGTGVASYVAANRPCKKLILETPYYSMKDLARHYLFLFPVNLLLKYTLPTYKNLKHTKAPVTLLHGTKDEVVPYKQSLKLLAENPNVELVSIENGRHNNLAQFPRYVEKIDSLFQTP